MRLIGLPIPDIQRENPRCVGRGLLLTRSVSTSFPEPVIEIGQSGRSTRPTAPWQFIIVDEHVSLRIRPERSSVVPARVQFPGGLVREPRLCGV